MKNEDALKTYWLNNKMNPLNCDHLHHVVSQKMGKKLLPVGKNKF